MLDELVEVIEALKARITDHGATLRENETRTRMALIDPLLQVLGWDTADPSLVTPEYDISGKRADYALLDIRGAPIVFLEAKRLDEPLSNHRSQVVAYASELGIKYPALTNGNEWDVYDNSKLVPIEQRRILNISIANSLPHQTALELLLLWRPNLESGEPVAANPPILGLDQPPSPEPALPPPPQGPSGDWTPLSEFLPKPKDKFPSEMRFPDGQVRQTPHQRRLLIEIAEYLIRMGKLTHVAGTIESGPSRYICHSRPQHKTGQDFSGPHELSNRLFLETHSPAHQTVAHANRLLKHCGEGPEQVLLKFS